MVRVPDRARDLHPFSRVNQTHRGQRTASRRIMKFSTRRDSVPRHFNLTSVINCPDYPGIQSARFVCASRKFTRGRPKKNPEDLSRIDGGALSAKFTAIRAFTNYIDKQCLKVIFPGRLLIKI